MNPLPGAAASQAAGRRLVVFDFDHTLYDGDSGMHLIVWLLRRQCWRVLVALLVSPVFAPLFLRAGSRRVAISGYLWIASIGLKRRGDLDTLIDRYVGACADAVKARLLPQALEVLRAHLQAGDRVVVATGAPTELARAALAFVAHEDVPVVGTEVGRRYGAVIALRHCHARNKLKMLAEAGFGGAIARAYSDSRADIPLLRAAAHPVVVNPRPSALEDFRRALGADVEIRDWGARR